MADKEKNAGLCSDEEPDYSTEYTSCDISIDKLIKMNVQFLIPIYQRLFVWGQEPVQTLLWDLLSSFEEYRTEGQKEKDEHIFYLGNVIVRDRSNYHGASRKGAKYELIDGQQRFTVLWLLSACLQHDLKDFAFPGGGSGKEDAPPLRVDFEIRDDEKEFMKKVIAFYQENKEEKDLSSLTEKSTEKSNNSSLNRLYQALMIIQTFVNQEITGVTEKKKDLKKSFSNFVRDNVKLVLTIVPEGVDLNKLFEVLNNRGVQLEPHHILKSRMLQKLNYSEHADNKDYYADLWEASARMDNYLEVVFSGNGVSNILDLDIGDQEYWEANKVINAMSQLDQEPQAEEQEAGQAKKLSVKQVLKHYQPSNGDSGPKDSSEEDKRTLEVESIIDFPMLLQHTLRIYLIENGECDIDGEEGWDLDRIHGKELLEKFETYFTPEDKEAQEIADFIQLLWEVRFMFDEYVVKWLLADDRILKLNNRYKSDKKFYRDSPKKNREVSQLQRLLYHSQDNTTFYWLTPYLYFLHKHHDQIRNEKETKPDLGLVYLKYLDNHLLNIDTRAEDISVDSLIERTARFMEEIKSGTIDGQRLDQPDKKPPLDRADGVSFRHYWFHKLEFILWRRFQEEDEIPELVDKEDIETFRINAKNSIEHIAPQNPEYRNGPSLDDETLDSFGNLALVTQSINSSYGNKSFGEKMSKFLASYQENNRIESLKLLMVFDRRRAKEGWGRKSIEAHEEEMGGEFEKYIKECEKEYQRLLDLSG